MIEKQFKENTNLINIITIMRKMNNECNRNNISLGKKIAESLNYFEENIDVLEYYKSKIEK